MPTKLKEFLLYLQTQGYSDKTIKEYEYDIMCFFKYVKEYYNLKSSIDKFTQPILNEIDEVCIYNYMYSTYDKSTSTRHTRLCAINLFYKWYGKRLEIQYPKKRQGLPKCLTLSQAKKLQHIFNKDNSKNPERDNLIMMIFLQTGLRISELKNIKIENIHKNFIILVGKGNKERKVYINKALECKIRRFIRKDDKYLVDISVSEIRYIVKKALSLIGAKGSPHTLRHTSATIIYKETKDILIVKEFLGHADVRATEVYLHINDEEVRKAVNKNPLANYQPKGADTNDKNKNRTNRRTSRGDS